MVYQLFELQVLDLTRLTFARGLAFAFHNELLLLPPLLLLLGPFQHHLPDHIVTLRGTRQRASCILGLLIVAQVALKGEGVDHDRRGWPQQAHERRHKVVLPRDEERLARSELLHALLDALKVERWHELDTS